MSYLRHEARMERAKRDVRFVAVWDGFGFCRRLWSAKRDMIWGLWCKWTRALALAPNYVNILVSYVGHNYIGHN